jgi:site-specific DNA-methyltransferase (adenine-specific)/modification methylase
MKICVPSPVIIGNATLYCGNCLEILQKLSCEDMALITDPLYRTRFTPGTKSRRNLRNSSLDWKNDGDAPKPEWHDMKTSPLTDFRNLDGYKEAIIWGGNNLDNIPAARGWLVWDKRGNLTSDDYGDGELAWTNLNTVIRIHRQKWRGIVREGIENVSNGPKVHPFQKPLALMEWCVNMTTRDVIDPFMGSGTTGVACMTLGRRFIGIEIEQKYFDIACERIDQAWRQQRLIP